MPWRRKLPWPANSGTTLDGAPAEPIRDRASAAVLREQVREQGRRLKLPTDAIESLAIVASELAANQLDHARYGEIAVREVTRLGAAGLEVVAIDQGRGLTPSGASFAKSLCCEANEDEPPVDYA